MLLLLLDEWMAQTSAEIWIFVFAATDAAIGITLEIMIIIIL